MSINATAIHLYQRYRLFKRSHYELTGTSKLSVCKKELNSTVRFNVSLATLDPKVVEVKYQAKNYMTWMQILLPILVMVLLQFLVTPQTINWDNPLVIAASSLMVLLAIFGILYRSKSFHYYVMYYRGTETPALYFTCKAVKDPSARVFIAELQEQIELAFMEEFQQRLPLFDEHIEMLHKNNFINDTASQQLHARVYSMKSFSS